MDLEWNDPRTRKFVTNVGLITSNGPNGNNIMSAEWTNHISYSPSLMAIHLTPGKATVKNIEETKQFGVNLASSLQNIVSSIAGGSSGKDVDKIEVLKELGIEFYKAKSIDVEMLKNAAMNAECKLVKTIEVGDHIMFIGEVQEISAQEEPLAYHNGKYWKLSEQIQKPSPDDLEKIKKLVEKHSK